MNLFIIFTAKYVLYIIVLLAVAILLMANRNQQKILAKISVIAFPLAYIIAKVAGHFVYNVRPFVVEHVRPLIAHAADNGFPSDHTLLSMTIAAVIFTYNKKYGVILAVLALAVGFARVLAKVHHSIDILASSVIAIAATYVAWHVLKYFKQLS